MKTMHEQSALQGESSNKAMLETTLCDEDTLNLALRREPTNFLWRPNWDPLLSTLKGPQFAIFHVPYLNTIYHNIVLPKLVHIDYPCVSLSLSWHSYNPLNKGSLFHVEGSFRMHKDYWEAKQDKMELVTRSEADDPSLHVLKAEELFKRSLELEATKEELDFFKGKLTQDDIKGLVVRLKMLKRNMEVKGQVLKATMHEPTLLVFLARRVQKFLLKLQAFWRARRPKEKKKGANTKNSTWKLPFYKKAELIKWNHVEEELKSFHDKSGQDMLINGYTKNMFFKENFKPP